MIYLWYHPHLLLRLRSLHLRPRYHLHHRHLFHHHHRHHHHHPLHHYLLHPRHLHRRLHRHYHPFQLLQRRPPHHHCHFLPLIHLHLHHHPLARHHPNLLRDFVGLGLALDHQLIALGLKVVQKSALLLMLKTEDGT